LRPRLRLMSVLKPAVDLLVMPLTLVLLLAAVGIVLRRLSRTRSGNVLLILAVVFAYASSTGLLAKAMMTPLERTYAPLPEASLPAVKFVVVLGSAYHPRHDIPITASLDYDGLARIVEGVRLARRLPEARLVVSGGPPGPSAPARGYARLARQLGIKEDALTIIEKETQDTASEAQQIAAYLGTAPFLLVTSADHMPRAMLLMKRVGAHPIPAPATQRTGPLWRGDFLPRSQGLAATELAMHEYVGLAAIALGLD
jgi:uncharacterized SAM-binding protein YcdF (DUF218 family)